MRVTVCHLLLDLAQGLLADRFIHFVDYVPLVFVFRHVAVAAGDKRRTPIWPDSLM